MALNLNNVSLKITAGTVRQFPRSATPQIALAGRSNVEKVRLSTRFSAGARLRG